MEINKELNDIYQEYFVKPQLIDSEESPSGEVKSRDEELKRVIQKMFIKFVILEFDSIKPMLEDVEGAERLHKAISDKDSREAADEVFYGAIKEVQEFIAGEYGMGPRRKKEYEKLAEHLEEKYGDGAIENNVNRVILKNRGSNIGDSCKGGGCSSC